MVLLLKRSFLGIVVSLLAFYLETEAQPNACLTVGSGMRWCQDSKNQCFVNRKQYRDDRLDNPMFNGGGFWSYATTLEECARKCADPKTKDRRGRRCVAFEFSRTSTTTIKSRSRCAFAWGCDYTKYWGGGSVWRPTKACLTTKGGREWCQDSKNQCFINRKQYHNDRLDNPMFNGGGFWSLATTMEECARKCADPRTVDRRGRRCVAFEFSRTSKTTLSTRSRCAFAWGCDYTKYWGGGSVWRPTKACLTTKNGREWCQDSMSQCFVNKKQLWHDRLDNPMFNGGGFWSLATTMEECARKCADPRTMDRYGRRCVAFEFSKPFTTTLSSRSRCAFAWGCDYTKYWGGGSVWRPTKACLTTRSGKKWCQDTKSQCFVTRKRYRYDRLDNPMFNGGGFWSTATTMEQCARECANPRNVDPKGRRCVAFEFSIPSKTNLHSRSRCAFAWGCDYTKYWSGGSVWKPAN